MRKSDIDKYLDALKDCPFCGEKPALRLFLGRYTVCCTNCPACMIPNPLDYDEDVDTRVLVNCWNERQ